MELFARDATVALASTLWKVGFMDRLHTKPQEQRQQDDDQQAELRKLRAELKRVTEERDILKKAAAYFAKECG